MPKPSYFSKKYFRAKRDHERRGHHSSILKQINNFGEEKIWESVNQSSATVRAICLTTIAFFSYVIIVVGATTDLMLFLSNSNVILPILNVEIDLWSFYLITPLVILVLHIFLLINLDLHNRRLADFQLAGGRNHNLLHPFIFNHSRREDLAPITRLFVKALVILIVYILPLTTQLVIQYRFLAYHDTRVSLWHSFICLALFFCSVIYHILWRSKNDGKPMTILTLIWRGVFISIAFISLILIGLIPEMVKSDSFSLPSKALQQVSLNLSRNVQDISPIDEQLVQIYLDSTRRVDVSKAMAIANHGERIDIGNRDFQYANLISANLSNAYGVKSTFRYARIREGRFFRSNFSEASFESVSLILAQFFQTNLNGVNFQFADLQNVIFEDCPLIMADFRSADLRGTTIKQSERSIPHLKGLDMQGAQFDGARMDSKTSIPKSWLPFIKVDSIYFGKKRRTMKGAELSEFLNSISY